MSFNSCWSLVPRFRTLSVFPSMTCFSRRPFYPEAITHCNQWIMSLGVYQSRYDTLTKTEFLVPAERPTISLHLKNPLNVRMPTVAHLLLISLSKWLFFAMTCQIVLGFHGIQMMTFVTIAPADDNNKRQWGACFSGLLQCRQPSERNLPDHFSKFFVLSNSS